jgi:arsenate reductase (thioredoxin)
MASTPEVLFVCVHNAGRSQMASAVLDEVGGGRVRVRSAGSAPADQLNRRVIEAMAEVGLNISREFPKPLTDDGVKAADVVITMGCGDECALYPGKRYEDWELDDPANLDLDGVRRVRDELTKRVHVLLDEVALMAPHEKFRLGRKSAAGSHRHFLADRRVGVCGRLLPCGLLRLLLLPTLEEPAFPIELRHRGLAFAA